MPGSRRNHSTSTEKKVAKRKRWFTKPNRVQRARPPIWRTKLSKRSRKVSRIRPRMMLPDSRVTRRTVSCSDRLPSRTRGSSGSSRPRKTTASRRKTKSGERPRRPDLKRRPGRRR